jgi:hypothetical protein
MIENRVTTKEYGTLPSNSPLLVPVATTPGYAQQRLHILAAQAFDKMSIAVQEALGFPLLCASGWRPHRWKSWQQYQDFVTKKYGSLSEGRKWLAFDSPHETGLACDLKCGGLEPNRATIAQQIRTPLHKWLDQNEHLYGFTDYAPESWHKEMHISLNAYRTGIADEAQIKAPVVTAMPTTLNDVCEDNTCMESPLINPASL